LKKGGTIYTLTKADEQCPMSPTSSGIPQPRLRRLMLQSTIPITERITPGLREFDLSCSDAKPPIKSGPGRYEKFERMGICA
jgi:hypothetical protein